MCIRDSLYLDGFGLRSRLLGFSWLSLDDDESLLSLYHFDNPAGLSLGRWHNQVKFDTGYSPSDTLYFGNLNDRYQGLTYWLNNDLTINVRYIETRFEGSVGGFQIAYNMTSDFTIGLEYLFYQFYGDLKGRDQVHHWILGSNYRIGHLFDESSYLDIGLFVDADQSFPKLKIFPWNEPSSIELNSGSYWWPSSSLVWPKIDRLGVLSRYNYLLLNFDYLEKYTFSPLRIAQQSILHINDSLQVGLMVEYDYQEIYLECSNLWKEEYVLHGLMVTPIIKAKLVQNKDFKLNMGMLIKQYSLNDQKEWQTAYFGLTSIGFEFWEWLFISTNIALLHRYNDTYNIGGSLGLELKPWRSWAMQMGLSGSMIQAGLQYEQLKAFKINAYIAPLPLGLEHGISGTVSF